MARVLHHGPRSGALQGASPRAAELRAPLSSRGSEAGGPRMSPPRPSPARLPPRPPARPPAGIPTAVGEAQHLPHGRSRPPPGPCGAARSPVRFGRAAPRPDARGSWPHRARPLRQGQAGSGEARRGRPEGWAGGQADKAGGGEAADKGRQAGGRSQAGRPAREREAEGPARLRRAAGEASPGSGRVGRPGQAKGSPPRSRPRGPSSASSSAFPRAAPPARAPCLPDRHLRSALATGRPWAPPHPGKWDTPPLRGPRPAQMLRFCGRAAGAGGGGRVATAAS